jgi:hypothetical protein
MCIELCKIQCRFCIIGMITRFILLLSLVFLRLETTLSASYIVAASNSPESAKKRADIVCDGVNDAKILRESLMQGTYKSIEYYDNAWNTGYAYTGQSVEWMAGDYYLSSTLYLPTVVDTLLNAEGAIFHYNATSGDAIVIVGALRSRFYLGTIFSSSTTGAALAARPSYYSTAGNTNFFPILMNFISWQGLQHDPIDSYQGQGFVAQNAFCTNAVIGTDIRGFNIGIWNDPSIGGGTIDTNWYWLSYVRHNMKNILVDDPTDGSVNAQQWFVNVDSMNNGAVSVKTGGKFDWWRIIMGTWDRSPSTRSIILDPNAEGNIFEITPSLWKLDGYENNADHADNAFIQIPQGVQPVGGKRSHLINSMSQFVDGDAAYAKGSVTSDQPPSLRLAEQLAQLVDTYQQKLIDDKEYQNLRIRVIDRFAEK